MRVELFLTDFDKSIIINIPCRLNVGDGVHVDSFMDYDTEKQFTRSILDKIYGDPLMNVSAVYFDVDEEGNFSQTAYLEQ